MQDMGEFQELGAYLRILREMNKKLQKI
jgi:hypothetical protein